MRNGSRFQSPLEAVEELIWHQRSLPRILKEGGFDLLHIPSYRRIVAFCPTAQLATVHDCARFT